MKKLFQEGGSQARNWWLSSGIIFNHVKNWNYCDVIYEVLAQHYGLETGWLDITNDFKIALFFAVCYWCDGEWLLRIFHRGLLK